MFEALGLNMGLDTVIVSAIAGACTLSFAASVYLFYRAKPQPEAKELDDIVQNAPYHRLHNILKIKA
ncbi:hypothetical protein RA19_00560 [Leisingera sp. ANG-M1]|uniref:hypothetical protein n=1 Tax=Leisingera sp. ANG-M1 TaxID=1577895 RepID=UPI00057EAB77|nr:hypothetical protein [Leisingera sp. ANG-M1]KIC12929.1 hypothetical protein RA19_00560 [Leisingera sp. ANG-M1]